MTAKAGSSLEIPEKIKVDGAKGAFARAQSLRSIRIKSTKMTSGSIARGAFSGTYKKLQIIIPKRKKSLYKSWLYKAGVSKNVKFVLK